MQIDFTKFVRAATLRPAGTGRFETEIGTLAVARRGGDWRLTFGTATKPDYGLVDSRGFEPAAGHEVTPGIFRFGDETDWLEFATEPLRVRFGRKGWLDDPLTSITDEHFRGWTRVPTAGPPGATWWW